MLAAVMASFPPGYSHWSTRQLGEKFSLGRTAVSKILGANSLKPHRKATFMMSRDPELDTKVWDVVGLYLNRPTKAVVGSLDEKTPKRISPKAHRYHRELLHAVGRLQC